MIESEKNIGQPTVELTNMVMIEDKKSGKVLVQERIKSWRGVSFPGGHIEPGESFVDSAVREVKEETGLDIRSLRLCGTVHWAHRKNHNRYIVFLYKTSDYSGSLVDSTDEGRVFWAKPEELESLDLSPNFEKYVPMFLSDEHSEAYGMWSEDGEDVIIYK